MAPDLDRDVVVRHVKSGAAEERWIISIGRDTRAEIPDPNAALVFARLLADLQQRPVWVAHGSDEELTPVDHRGLHGCSCC